MEFIKAKLEDADKIAELLVECFNITSLEEGKETFLKERQKDNFIIAEEDGKFYGLVSWDMHGLPKHQLVRIERIGILANPNREEISEGLLTTAIQDSDKFFKTLKLKLRKVYTMVHSTNKKLINFYKNRGFVEEAQLKDHYYKGQDEIILSMFLE